METPHGLILTPVTEDHYVFGGASKIVNKPVIMPNGHGWLACAPTFEYQAKNGFDSMNCTNYGTHHALCTLAKAKGFTNFPTDCSERYSGVLTGTTPQGNDPHKVIELIRTQIGVVPEAVLPFTDDISTWGAYYTQQSAQWLESLGAAILRKFLIGHEWVIPNELAWNPSKQDRLKDALQYGPIALSVHAWKERNGMYYKDDTDYDNHWVTLLDYEDGVSWTIFDDYDTSIKTLEWHYNFIAAKIYYMDRITPTFFSTFWDYVLNLFAPKATPQPVAQTSVAPAEASSTPVIVAQPPGSDAWDTPRHCFHNVRVLCDQLGLTLEQKNTICACIYQESRFNNAALNHNKNSSGVTTSTDYGICQINDYFHIGAGKTFPSLPYVLNNPDKVVTWMIQCMKKGQLSMWVSYSSGAYKQWLLPNSPMWALKNTI